MNKYDEMPFRESRWQYLLRKVGNMYDIKKFDHDVASYKWWKYTSMLLKSSIGKSYDKVYSKWCKVIPDRYRGMWDWYFKPPHADFIIDKQKRIKIGWRRGKK